MRFDAVKYNTSIESQRVRNPLGTRVSMGSIAAFGALDADALGSLADAIERDSGPSAVVSLASTCTTLWRGHVLRLDNGTGPHALKGKLDVLRQEAINGLTQKLECEDLRSLLRSSPDLSDFEVMLPMRG